MTKKLETTRWDVTDFLDSDAAIEAYLEAVVQAGDADEMHDALCLAARATATRDRLRTS